jgi:hypothetical protein
MIQCSCLIHEHCAVCNPKAFAEGVGLRRVPRHAVNSPNPKQRYGDLKVPVHLVPSAGVLYEALAFAEGARKYGPYNWREKSVEAMTYIGAAMRHIQCYLDGEEYDPEITERPTHHLGLARACLGILADCIETGNLIDNRPPKGRAGPFLRENSLSPAGRGDAVFGVCAPCAIPQENSSD